MKYTVEEFWNRYYDLPYNEREAAFEEWYQSIDVGDKVNVLLYSDREPATVIKKTAKTLTVRYDKAHRDPNWKPEWIAGGFSAICTNDNDQKWIIEDDPFGKIEVFRWHKNAGHYISANGLKLFPGWMKYYDYNF